MCRLAPAHSVPVCNPCAQPHDAPFVSHSATESSDIVPTVTKLAEGILRCRRAFSARKRPSWSDTTANCNALSKAAVHGCVEACEGDHSLPGCLVSFWSRRRMPALLFVFVFPCLPFYLFLCVFEDGTADRASRLLEMSPTTKLHSQPFKTVVTLFWDRVSPGWPDKVVLTILINTLILKNIFQL